MTIYTEFERFRTYALDATGFQEIQDRWFEESNYEKRPDGNWYRISAGDGRLAGFAIDPITWRFEIGPKGYNHENPVGILAKSLYEKEQGIIGGDDPLDRIIKGRIAYIDTWKFPVVCVLNPRNLRSEALDLTEEKILEFGIGLPYSKLCIHHVFTARRP